MRRQSHARGVRHVIIRGISRPRNGYPREASGVFPAMRPFEPQAWQYPVARDPDTA